MADLFELTAEVRKQLGKGENRRLRRLAQKVPAIVYGGGKKPTPIVITHRHIDAALKNEAFFSHILTLHIDGHPEKVVLKDLQRHPYKAQILHADFLRISATEKLYMQVPIRFLNEATAPGVKIGGGVVSHLLNEVEVRCLPADLPEAIEVDLANVQLGESIHLSDLKLPQNVEIVALLHQDDRPIVSVHKLNIVEEPETVVAPPAEVPLVGKENKEESEKD